MSKMATTGQETTLPIREEEKQQGAMEQEINPWDVQAAQDENGNILAFNYVAISQCVTVEPRISSCKLTRDQEVGHETDHR